MGDAQTEVIEKGIEIERIYLLSTYQNKGIGQLMLNKILEIAATLGNDKIWLGVWKKNKGAIRFYERNGFRKFGDHSFFLGTDKQTDILMEFFVCSP